LRLTPSLTPIGTIRASRSSSRTTTSISRPQPHYKLSRLAVLKEYRGHQFGHALVQRLHDWVLKDATSARLAVGQDNGKELAAPVMVDVIAHSQIPVKGFYTKFGYEPEGPEFDEDGDPHQKMVLRMLLGIARH